MDPQVVIIAGSNDHLQRRGLLKSQVGGSCPNTEVIGEVIMTLLLAMFEAEKSIQRCFARQLVEVVFILSPGYASLTEPLQFVYAMIALLAEGRFDVVIQELNRQVNHKLY